MPEIFLFPTVYNSHMCFSFIEGISFDHQFLLVSQECYRSTCAVRRATLALSTYGWCQGQPRQLLPVTVTVLFVTLLISTHIISSVSSLQWMLPVYISISHQYFWDAHKMHWQYRAMSDFALHFPYLFIIGISNLNQQNIKLDTMRFNAWNEIKSTDQRSPSAQTLTTPGSWGLYFRVDSISDRPVIMTRPQQR